MWPKNYRDYPVDTSLKKEKVEPSRGIIGAEMHEINGWGNSLHQDELKHPIPKEQNQTDLK